MASDSASVGGAAVPSRPRTKVGDPHDDGAGEMKPSYRSWKKKYRKMRVVFDKKMNECEELYQKELKAKALIKRLAIENDRILDLLLDNNNSAQIPPSRRIDLALSPSADPREHAELDVDTTARPSTPTKTSFGKLLAEVPHSNFADTLKSLPTFAQDVEPLEGEAHPLSFLSADDIDNYMYEIDRRIDAEDMLPTLAPAAKAEKLAVANGTASAATGANGATTNGNSNGASGAAAAGSAALSNSSRDFALKNPISVYNWLRKHAPNTFLQDGEAATGEDVEGDGKKASRASKGERGSKPSGRGKRTSLAARGGEGRGDWDADDDPEYTVGATPSGRGKRKRDDDPGYRPKSGSRPAKKKRKSDGDGTPTANRRAKKEPRDD